AEEETAVVEEIVEEAVEEVKPVAEETAEEEEAPVAEEAVPAVSRIVEPEETVEEEPSRFANLEFGENYETLEPLENKKGFFGRKK
ncbi:MAG: hypothetical protein IIX68_00260, partial [Clostridia bacterium]|nr:hypothetical protein [Clostridia bacterium]